jgi:hypothetical protein
MVSRVTALVAEDRLTIEATDPVIVGLVAG